MGEEKKHKHKSEHREKRKHKKHKKNLNDEVNNSEDEQALIPTHGDVSLSIEETNKLREKLGLTLLKPSKETVTETADGLKQYTLNGDTFVHKKPENWGNRREAEKLTEKLLIKKQKRDLETKFKNVKTLADNEDESAASWVLKSKQLQNDKQIAAKKAKMLEELDEEFGIGQLIESNLPYKRVNYTEKDLKGFKVKHSIEAIQEGETMIMTLADKDILMEMEESEKTGGEEIVLHNVNLIDEEMGQKNIETRGKKIDYKPYLEDEKYDEFGMFKPKNLLDKYDEEVGIVTEKESFTIGEGGIVNASQMKHDKDEYIKKMRANLNIQTLETTPFEIAKEYYTHEEMEAKIRKKPKKKMKLRQIRIDYESDGPNDTVQSTKSNKTVAEAKISEEDLVRLVEMEEEKGLLELEESLNKVRRIKSANLIDSTSNQTVPKGSSKVGELIKNKVSQLVSDDEEDTTVAATEQGKTTSTIAPALVLNKTSEFCRSLRGLQETSNDNANKINSKNDQDVMEIDKGENSDSENDFDTHSDAGESHENESKRGAVKVAKPKLETITQEPDIQIGLGQALELIKSKGYLDKPDENPGMSAEYLDLQCKRFMVEDKHYELDDKNTFRRDRYANGPMIDFKEKREYVPDFKLDYVDDQGNLLNTKEAFRFLSHKFHGKGAGKKKIDKRAKKYLEKLNATTKSHEPSSSLETVNLLLNKQKEIKAPYLILSGKSAHISG